MATLATLFVEISADTRRYDAALKAAEKKLSAFQRTVRRYDKALRSIGQGMTVMGIAGAAAIYKSVTAYGEAEKAAAKLDAAVTAAATAGITLQADRIRQLATEIQNYSGISDEAVQVAGAMLGTFQLSQKQIEALLPRIANMSAMYGVTMQQAAVQMGRAMTVGTEGLRRFGVIIDSSLDPMKDFAGFLKAIDTNTGPAARALGETAAGQVAILKQQMGDLNEAIGKAFLPLLKTIVEDVTPVVAWLQKWIDRNPQLASALAMSAAAVTAFNIAVGPLLMGLPTIARVLPQIVKGIRALTAALIPANAALATTNAQVAALSRVGMITLPIRLVATIVGPGAAIVAALIGAGYWGKVIAKQKRAAETAATLGQTKVPAWAENIWPVAERKSLDRRTADLVKSGAARLDAEMKSVQESWAKASTRLADIAQGVLKARQELAGLDQGVAGALQGSKAYAAAVGRRTEWLESSIEKMRELGKVSGQARKFADELTKVWTSKGMPGYEGATGGGRAAAVVRDTAEEVSRRYGQILGLQRDLARGTEDYEGVHRRYMEWLEKSSEKEQYSLAYRMEQALAYKQELANMADQAARTTDDLTNMMRGFEALVDATLGAQLSYMEEIYQTATTPSAKQEAMNAYLHELQARMAQLEDGLAGAVEGTLEWYEAQTKLLALRGQVKQVTADWLDYTAAIQATADAVRRILTQEARALPTPELLRGTLGGRAAERAGLASAADEALELAHAVEGIHAPLQGVSDLADEAGYHWSTFVVTATDGLTEWGKAGQAVMDSIRTHFEDALVSMIQGVSSFRDFWKALWQDVLRIAVHALVNTVLGAEQAANAISKAMSSAFSWMSAKWGMLGAIGGGLLGLFGVGKLLGGLFGGGPKAPPIQPPRVTYLGEGGAGELAGSYTMPTTAGVAAEPTRVVSVVVRVEEGAFQLSPENFDPDTAREAADAFFERIKHLFETEDLAEGLAQA